LRHASSLAINLFRLKEADDPERRHRQIARPIQPGIHRADTGELRRATEPSSHRIRSCEFVACHEETVGDEGMIGIAAFFGGRVMPGESMVQVPDTDAEQISVETFRNELDRRGALYDAVNRYAQGTMALMMQSTACMALHQVQERCCRWLLMTHDRVRSDQFSLSHEFLAMMLGSTRPTVTLVARSLQQAKVIRYRHAKVTILNRKGLEAMWCECYATIKAAVDRLGL
jgi:CRP-like cAMP-binding protein